MSILFWLSQAISIVLTAAAGVLLYVIGYSIGLTWKFCRWVYKEVF